MVRAVHVVVIALLTIVAPLTGACSGAMPAHGVDPSRGATENFRDVAGPAPGYSAHGGRFRPGRVYRSNVLALSSDERDYVQAHGVTQIFDLRTPAEITAHPDVITVGATYTEVDIMGEMSGPLAGVVNVSRRPASPAEAVAQATDVYRTLAGGEHQRRAYGQLLTKIATATGPVIIHCSAGKDRTGWAAALLQSIAGVSRADVYSDYMLSNEYSKKSISEALDRTAQAHGRDAADAIRPILGVQPSFLDAAFDVVDHQFGGMDAYLTDGLNLTGAVLATLRAKLVPSS